MHFLQEAFEQQVNPEDREQMALLGEMRTHLKKVGVMSYLWKCPISKFPGLSWVREVYHP